MKIVITKKARKALDKIPTRDGARIISKILGLKENPYNPQLKKLTDQPGFRLRVGDYRVLYLIDTINNKIVIGRIKHRKDVYRFL